PSWSVSCRAWAASGWPTSSRRSRLSGSLMRASARLRSSSPVWLGSSSSRSARIGGPARHCQALSASRASRPSRLATSQRRGSALVGMIRGVGSQPQAGAVALGFQQLDLFDLGATLDSNQAEDLLQQRAARAHLQLPVLGAALQVQFEVTGQAAVVTAQHRQEQAALLAGGVLTGLRLPAVRVEAEDAPLADPVVLSQRLAQLPEQALGRGQLEAPLADQRLRQGAQMFFLDEGAADRLARGQPGAQLGQLEAPGEGGEQAEQQRPDEVFHCPFASAMARSTALTNTAGELNCISLVGTCTATWVLLPRVMRSPLAASRIR